MSVARRNRSSRHAAVRKEDLAVLVLQNSSRVQLVANASGRSDIWNCFKCVLLDGVPQPFVLCDFCRALVFYVSKNGTGSLLRHKCNADYAALQYSAAAVHVPEVTLPSPRASTTTTVATAAPATVTHEGLQQHLAEKEAAFLVKDLRPLDTVDGRGFMELAQALVDLGADYGKIAVCDLLVGGRQLARDYFSDWCGRIGREIAADVAENDPVLTIDAWSNVAGTRTVDVSCHYIDAEFRAKSALLGTRELADDATPHTAAVDVLRDYFGSVTDAQARWRSAVVVVQSDVDALAVWPEGSAPVLPSVCGMLNAVLDDVLVHRLDTFTALHRSISDAKCLVDYLDESGLWRYLAKAPPPPSRARRGWGVVYETLAGIRESYTEIQQIWARRGELVTQACSRTPPPQTLVGENVLAEILTFLELFKDCSESLSSGSAPTINECVLWRIKLENHCLTKVAGGVLGDVRRRLSENLKTTFQLHRLHYVALFLDPNFKALKMLSESERRTTMDSVAGLMREAAARRHERAAALVKSRSSTEPPTKKPRSPLEVFTEFLEAKENVEDPIAAELRGYQENSTAPAHVADVLEFWRTAGAQYPNLQQLARNVLAIPASVSATECPFSCEGKMLSERRSHLGSHVGPILFLHNKI